MYVALAAAALLLAGPLLAQNWEEGFPVRVTYEELGGEDSGFADVTLTMILPPATPLLAREAALGSALSALHDIWDIESIHEEVRGFLTSAVPMEVQRTVSEITGEPFIVDLMDAFEDVEDNGYSRFQSERAVTGTERMPIAPQAGITSYRDAPRRFEWVVGGAWPIESPSHESWVLASLVNCSAAILSFRSEFRRFPSSFAELRETGHLLIEPMNPYEGRAVQDVRGVSRGDIAYEFINPNRVTLQTWIDVAGQPNPVHREINSSGAFDLLYRQSVGFSEDDKQVARYVFQISQILNEYYFQRLDLPYSVPQLESEGFAYVSFPNPYSGRDAQQADSLADIQPGDYTYHRVSASAYFLAGYGGSGISVLTISKDFGRIEPGMGLMRTE